MGWPKLVCAPLVLFQCAVGGGCCDGSERMISHRVYPGMFQKFPQIGDGILGKVMDRIVEGVTVAIQPDHQVAVAAVSDLGAKRLQHRLDGLGIDIAADRMREQRVQQRAVFMVHLYGLTGTFTEPSSPYGRSPTLTCVNGWEARSNAAAHAKPGCGP